MKKLTYLLMGVSAAFGTVVGADVPSGSNLFPNGDFKGKTKVVENLWNGVDSKGYLNASVASDQGLGSVLLLKLTGDVGFGAVPVSVSVADLNGDGLLDLMAASNSGYILAYFNRGTKTQPKFGNAEVLPLYLARGYFPEAFKEGGNNDRMWRRAPRICFFDGSRSGKPDLLVGNYRGELLFIPNRGTPANPDFRQTHLDQARVLANKAWWGNLFAPVMYDFNGDGRLDVALGEGSYSANAIHLLLNKGSNGLPKFEDNPRYYLAFGDGNEQLVPTLADYNGDGLMDILVGDREGKVAVYLNPGGGWKPGDEFKLYNYITFGSARDLREAVAPCAADLNGDGLFDLVFGKTNGHIAVAYNTGSASDPKFGMPVDLKAADVVGPTCKLPAEQEWRCNTGITRGNPYALVSLVSSKDDPGVGLPDDHLVMKVSYSPSPNVVFKSIIPVAEPPKEITADRLRDHPFGGWWGGYEFSQRFAPSNEFTIRCEVPRNTLVPGKRYRLSFSVKGANLAKTEWRFASQAHTKSEKKVERGERGSAKVTNVGLKSGIIIEEGRFTASQTWAEVSKTIQLNFKEPELRDPESIETIVGVLEIRADLKPSEGTMYIDNVQLVETR